ncbi:unnamed protein product, partial [Ilex paraguariensis]
VKSKILEWSAQMLNKGIGTRGGVKEALGAETGMTKATQAASYKDKAPDLGICVEAPLMGTMEAPLMGVVNYVHAAEAREEAPDLGVVEA